MGGSNQPSAFIQKLPFIRDKFVLPHTLCLAIPSARRLACVRSLSLHLLSPRNRIHWLAWQVIEACAKYDNQSINRFETIRQIMTTRNKEPASALAIRNQQYWGTLLFPERALTERQLMLTVTTCSCGKPDELWRTTVVEHCHATPTGSRKSLEPRNDDNDDYLFFLVWFVRCILHTHAKVYSLRLQTVKGYFLRN